MEKIKSWKIISDQGKKIKKMLNNVARRNGLNLEISGLDSSPSYSIINSKKWLEYKTFITQELLKQNILGANTTYVSISHNDKVIKNYEEKLNDIFFSIYKIIHSKKKISNFLDGPVSHSGFRRLN